MDFPLHCDCGETVFANEGMAGSRIVCKCGRPIPIPSLDEIRRRKLGSVAEGLLPRPTTPEEPFHHPRTVAVYVVAVGLVCVFNLPFVLFCFFRGGPVAGMGSLVLLAGQVWLFTLIYAGNPVAAIVALLPVVGPVLTLSFIVAHFRVARGPLLCQLLGYLIGIAGMVSSTR